MSELSRADIEVAQLAAESMAEHVKSKLGVNVTVLYDMDTRTFNFKAYFPVPRVALVNLEFITVMHINELKEWLTRAFGEE